MQFRSSVIRRETPILDVSESSSLLEVTLSCKDIDLMDADGNAKSDKYFSGYPYLAQSEKSVA